MFEQNLGGQTKSIMVFSEVAFGHRILNDRDVPLQIKRLSV